MYAINTFLRVVRFIANSFLGLIIGFIIGYLFASYSPHSIINSLELWLK